MSRIKKPKVTDYDTAKSQAENNRAKEEAKRKKNREVSKLKSDIVIQQTKLHAAVENIKNTATTLTRLKRELIILQNSSAPQYEIDAKLEEISDAEKLLEKYYKDRNNANNLLITLNAQLNNALNTKTTIIVPKTKDKPKTSANPAGGSHTQKKAPTPKPIYKYNAPMVKEAYFTPLGPQAENIYGGILDPVNYQDAISSWKNGKASKGVIQMDRLFASDAQKPKAQDAKGFDDNLYGFKFLYNPTQVSMGWGTSTEVNWDYVSLGLDKSNAMAQSILKSTITFSILLNRISDFSYINESGLIPNQTFLKAAGATFGEYISTLEDRQQGSFWKTITDAAQFNAINPYPSTVDPVELQEIYKKGTMYDLEYLFKTTMGLNATYKSTLNGSTADRGWLTAIPVELHLGDGMRYRVRISTLNVNHAMFNSRMVPILSTVDFTCHRYYDGPEITSNLTSSKTSSSPSTTAKPANYGMMM